MSRACLLCIYCYVHYNTHGLMAVLYADRQGNWKCCPLCSSGVSTSWSNVLKREVRYHIHSTQNNQKNVSLVFLLFFSFFFFTPRYKVVFITISVYAWYDIFHFAIVFVHSLFIIFLIWYWNASPKRSMVPASPNFICHFSWEQYWRD